MGQTMAMASLITATMPGSAMAEQPQIALTDRIYVKNDKLKLN
jgi:hypothetical protein